jgi:hypothetical protein
MKKEKRTKFSVAMAASECDKSLHRAQCCPALAAQADATLVPQESRVGLRSQHLLACVLSVSPTRPNPGPLAGIQSSSGPGHLARTSSGDGPG